MAIATVGMVATHGDLLMTDTWNPSAAVLASFVLLAAAWRATEADRGAVVSVLLAFSLVAQAHVGFTMVMLPPVVAALVISARRWWIAGHGVDHRAAWAAVALAIMWLPVLVDTVRYRPGNLADLADWWIGDDEPTGGLVEGARVVARASSVSWPSTPESAPLLSTVDVGVGWLPGATIVALIAVLVLARRAQLFGVARMLAVAGLAWLGVLIGAAGTRPTLRVPVRLVAPGGLVLVRGAGDRRECPRCSSMACRSTLAVDPTAAAGRRGGDRTGGHLRRGAAGVVRAQPPGSNCRRQLTTSPTPSAPSTRQRCPGRRSKARWAWPWPVAGWPPEVCCSALPTRWTPAASRWRRRANRSEEFGRRRAGATPDVTYLIALASDEALVPLDATKVTCEGELSHDDDLRRLQLRGQLTDTLVAAGLGDRVSVLNTRLSAAALSVEHARVLALQPELVELQHAAAALPGSDLSLFALQAWHAYTTSTPFTT